MYKLTHRNTIINLIDGSIIPTSQNNPQYLSYLEWIDQGNTPEPADPLPEPGPNWKEFLVAVKMTSIFTQLRIESRSDVGINALATELQANLISAALGLPDILIIQSLLDELIPFLTVEQQTEIGTLIIQYNIPLNLS